VEHGELRRADTRRRVTIAVLADHVTNGYQNTILFGASDELREAGVTAVLYAGGVIDSPDPMIAQRNAVYDLVHPDRVDGIIMLSPLGNQVGQAGLATFCKRFAGLPLCTLSVEVSGASSVLVDNDAGMRQVLEHVVTSHRRRRIAFIRGPANNVEAERRFRAYRDVLERHRIAFDADLVTIGDFNAPSGAQAVAVLCDERRVQFDALVGANDYMALGAMQALQARGMDVPGAIAIAGFDDIEEARFATPPLTTVRQPLYDSGRLAARVLLARLHDPNEPARRTVLETQLVLRESCGCIADEALSQPPAEFSRVSSLAAFLADRREQVIDALTDAVPAEHARIPCDWPAPLFEAFVADVRDGAGKRFLPLLTTTLRRAAEAGGSLRAWNAVVGALHAAAAAASGDDRGAARAGDLLHGARVLVGDMRERVQAQHGLRRERSIRALHETSEALMTTFDVDALVATMSAQLPRLDIPACVLSLYERADLAAKGAARPLLVYDDGARAEPPAEPIAANALAPGEWIDARARTLIVEPLAFRGEQLGFGVFEMGPLEGAIYEGLREILSAALKGARLVVQVVEEEKRRHHAERQRLEEEMAIAARIQTSIVPKSIRVPGLEIAATMIPATEVGGDYYDIISCANGCWLGIGDVAGHGLKTGLVALMIQSVVAAVVQNNPRATPSSVVRILNAVMFENVRRRLSQDEHATLSMMRYDGEGRFVFAGAHEEIIVFRAAQGRCECIPTPGPWVGAVPELGATLVDTPIALAPDDVMVLYTDGVTEAMDNAGVQFGMDRVCELVRRAAAEPARDICEHIVDAVRHWTAKQNDDISVVVVRRA